MGTIKEIFRFQKLENTRIFHIAIISYSRVNKYGENGTFWLLYSCCPGGDYSILKYFDILTEGNGGYGVAFPLSICFVLFVYCVSIIFGIQIQLKTNLEQPLNLFDSVFILSVLVYT